MMAFCLGSNPGMNIGFFGSELSFYLFLRLINYPSTLPSMFGGDEDDIVSMTQDLALSEGYDVAVFVQVKGLELGTSASGLTL